MTHRVAGPIYIISRYLGQLADGQVPQTRPLRRGDELKTFFDTFSAAVESLRRENLAEVELLQQAAAALDQQQGQAELAESLRQLAADKKKWEQETD
jgi:hypothetical protein